MNDGNEDPAMPVLVGRPSLGDVGRPYRWHLGHRACMAGLVVTTLMGGCTTTGAGLHRETRVKLGLELLGVRLVSVGEIEYQEISPACVAEGDRLTGSTAPAPVSIFATDSSGFHLIKAGISDEQARALLEAQKQATQPPPGPVPPTLNDPEKPTAERDRDGTGDVEEDAHRPDDRERHQ